MATQFTPCPACGAIGEVNSTCQFCGTSILLKEGAIISDSRIVKQRTVTPQQYAEKISIYHNVVGLNAEISKVCIGEQEGLINLNGDLVYPLGNERITYSVQNGIVRIGRKYLNLETFEYTENVYSNKFVLEKIKLLSDAILKDQSEEGYVEIGFLRDESGEYLGDSLTICNASKFLLYNDTDRLPSQLMIIPLTECLLNDGELISRIKRINSCDDSQLFKICERDLDGTIIEERYRTGYILCNHDVERCTELVLQILSQAFDILPDDAHNHMECNSGVFGENGPNEHIPESANSGCLGMFALMIGIGGTGIYGLTQLIGNLIA